MNIEGLKRKMDESGMTIEAICKKASMERATMYNRLKQKSEFKASEIVSLTNVLGLTREERDEIFFAS